MKQIPTQKGDYLEPKRYQEPEHKRRNSRSSNSLKASKASKASKGSRNSKRMIQNKKKNRFKEDRKSRNKHQHDLTKVMPKYYIQNLIFSNILVILKDNCGLILN